jgi:hypothetical protein
LLLDGRDLREYNVGWLRRQVQTTNSCHVVNYVVFVFDLLIYLGWRQSHDQGAAQLPVLVLQIHQLHADKLTAC